MKFFFFLLIFLFSTARCFSPPNPFKFIFGVMNASFPSGWYSDYDQYHGGNHPGGREHHKVFKHENSIFVYGGYGYAPFAVSASYLEGLWEFDLDLGLWRLREKMSGQNFPSPNDFSSLNSLGPFSEGTSWQSSDEHYAYFYGGKISETFESHNWIWILDLRTLHFKYPNINGVINYNVEGEFSTLVKPRKISATTSCRYSDERTIIFGGKDLDLNDYFNEVWEYDMSLEQFRFVKGNKIADPISTYGDPGIFDETFIPCGRKDMVMWYDSNSNYIYLFGGEVKKYTKHMNDLWALDISTFNFAYLQGDLIGDDGGGQTLFDHFTFHEDNIPKRRMGMAHLKIGNYLYIFGSGADFSGDMWVFSLHSMTWSFQGGTFAQTMSNSAIDEIGWRMSSQMVYVNDRIYIVGGWGSSDNNPSKHLADLWKYTGWNCFDNYYLDPNVCNGNGTCIAVDECDCYLKNGYVNNEEGNCVLINENEPNLIDQIFGEYWFVFVIAGGVFGLCVLVGLIIAISIIIVNVILKKGPGKSKKLKDIDLETSKVEDQHYKVEFNFSEDLFKIPFNDINLIKEIGSGGSGCSVFLSNWKNTKVAFKVFNCKFGSQYDFSEFESELSLMCNLSHPHLVQFYGCSLKIPRVGIVMEFCEKGTIADVIMKKKINPKKKTVWAEQIATGVEFLHSKKIIWRDLKLENCGLNAKDIVKLIDFGVSKILYDRMSQSNQTKRVGTSTFMAPELCLGGIYDEKVDVFSFGIALCCLFENKVNPYDDFKGGCLELAVANSPTFRPKITPKKYPPGILKLMKECWDHDATNRKSFEGIVEYLKKLEI